MTAKSVKKRGSTMTVTEARAALGVSKAKMARLLATGELHATHDPLDKRFKLIPRAEVEALKARSQRDGEPNEQA